MFMFMDFLNEEFEGVHIPCGGWGQGQGLNK